MKLRKKGKLFRAKRKRTRKSSPKPLTPEQLKEKIASLQAAASKRIRRVR